MIVKVSVKKNYPKLENKTNRGQHVFFFFIIGSAFNVARKNRPFGTFAS